MKIQTLNDKELRRLTRTQLLEVLVAQSKEIDKLRKALEEVEAGLSEKEYLISQAENIAEACVSVCRVPDTVKEAVDLYLENILRICGEKAAEAGKTEEWNQALKDLGRSAND